MVPPRENSETDNNAKEVRQPQSFSINYRRILALAIKFWYTIVTSVLVGIFVAYLVNRYTTKIYPVTASIIIRESEENPDARFLFNNPLVSGYRNFINEPYIIRSYPIIQSVVEALGFEISIQKEGNVITTERYQLPIEIEVVGAVVPSTVKLQITDDGHFICGVDSDGSEKKEYRFGDTVNCNNNSFIVRTTQGLSRIVGEKYLVKFSKPEQIAANYIGKLKVSWAQQGSSVVNLDISGTIPQKEIDFLEKLISFYQEYDLTKKNQAAIRSLSFIENQLKTIGDSLKNFENQLEAFKRKNFVTDLSEEASELYTELKRLGDTRAGVLYSENYYKYVISYLNEAKSDYTAIILPSNIGIQDPVLNSLMEELIRVQSEINAFPTDKTTTNPLMAERNRQLIRTVVESRSRILEAINTLRSTDRIKIKGIDQHISTIETKLSSLPNAQRKLVNIQRNYTLSENLYLFLQQKSAEAGISKASTTSDIIIVNPPRLAGGHTTPKSIQNYLIYGGLGLVIPFLAFVLLEFFNDKIQSKEDIDRITTIPFIGAVGHNHQMSPLIVYEKPKSVLAESFRALRSNLNYFTAGKDKKVFMITSSISGEGKTFTTINLGTVLALSGKRAVIIGADLRRPKIFQEFNLTNTIGLSSYLSGLAQLDETIQWTSIENLAIISSGPVPPNPSELILSDRMSDLVESLKNQFDFILIDTPPIALITDALELAKFSDHTIFVIRQNFTPRAFLQMADDLYMAGKINAMSIMLNDIKHTGSGYGYLSHSYGYSYYDVNYYNGQEYYQ
jgi:capsular exopolysaccharide synthesis family protein